MFSHSLASDRATTATTGSVSLMLNDCRPGGLCACQAFTRSIDTFNGQPTWFYEYRVSATGNSLEIQLAAPTTLATGNSFGNLYHCTVASDQIKLSGDVDLPFLFLDVEEGVPHTIRLELRNDPPPATFQWFVDSVAVLGGLADGPFPDFNSRITWVGRTWMQPTMNAWFFIRAGDIPQEFSGDFNSDGEVDDFEVFYISECIQRSTAGEPAFPSCAWADADANNTVNCDDWTLIANDLWTGPGEPPDLPACSVAPIPAVSTWGVTILTLLTLTVGSLLFRRSHPRASLTLP